MEIYTLTFPGEPVPLARPRFSRRGTYDSQANVKQFYILHLLSVKHTWKKLYGPLEIQVEFAMPIPKGSKKRTRSLAYTPHVKRPDLSNLIKFIEDVMQGHIFDDDSQIVGINAFKRYDENPKTTLKIWSLDAYLQAN